MRSCGIDITCAAITGFTLPSLLHGTAGYPFIMGKSRKKKTVSGSAMAAGKVASKPKKKRPATVTKKSKRPGTTKAAAVPKSPTKAPPKAVVRTPPTKKNKKVVSVPTTPSTVSSKSTTQSKRAVKLMGGLALQSPSSSKRAKCEDVEEDSLSDTVDYQDPNTIPWLTKKGVADALEYHFPDQDDYITLDHQEQILRLVKKFKPADIRIVLQGLLTDAGKDWRKLKMNKLRNMNVLAPEFAKVCVDLFNATTELNSSTSVSEDIVFDHGKGQKKVPL